MKKRIYLSPPCVGHKEMEFVQQAFDTNWIAPIGPNVDYFEEEICGAVGINYGLALSSGTAGIHLALKYLGVGVGDTVFCSSLTFAGSCNPIVYLGAKPIFIDSEKETWNMSPEALQNAFDYAIRNNKLPKAVIIVDLYGQSAQYDLLLPICKKYNVPVIEDAAEALGASYEGKMCGTFGDVGVFSFNGNKIITTSGGGMVVSNNKEAIDKMRFWSTQAKEPVPHYEHKEVGYNYRLSNICAGIGRGQLLLLSEKIKKRKAIFTRYQELLKDLPIQFLPILKKGEPNYWLSVITINENCGVLPSVVINELDKKNIESRPVWKPMHMQPLYKNYAYFISDENISKRAFENGLCLPSGDTLTDDELIRICKTISKCF